jgi:cyanophycin synthetase
MTKKKNLEFLRVTDLRGPNIWTYRAVIEVWVDIGELEDYPSSKLPGFTARLCALLPGLAEHRCGVGTRGGFIERLEEGTYAAHILEHVVLELQTLAGMPTGFGQTRSTATRGVYKMAFRTREQQVGRAALELGRELLLAAINDEVFVLEEKLAVLRELVDDRCLGPSTAHIVEAASARRIPFIRLTDGNLVQLGHGASQRRIWTAETDQTSAIAEGIASDKDLTKTLLQSCGVPVPEGRMVDNAADAWDAACDIGLPVVVKPYDGNHGRGVSLDLSTQKDVEAAWQLAEDEGGGVIVEKFIPGNEYRLLIVGKRMVAAACGEAAWVTADGKASIAQLIDSQINSDPRRGMGEEFPLARLAPETDHVEILLELEKQGLAIHDVPASGKKILIQRNGNVADDVTDKVHPSIAAAAALAARVVGLDIAGVDLVAEDISKPLHAQRAAIIEVNASPGLLAHLKPSNGPGRDVGAAIIDYLFAPEKTGRIPVVGVAGSRGTTLIARLVAWLIHIGGTKVGVACSTGLYIGSSHIHTKDCANWTAGHQLLINPAVAAAVFENGARMILSEGLAYDRCAVGIVTDTEGHAELAQFHVHEAADMVKILRTQVDVVLADGAAVLNAGDAQVVEMAGLCDGSVIFYGTDQGLPAIIAHRSAGKRVVFLRDAKIVMAEGTTDLALLPLSTLKAALSSQPESVMAAVAGAWSLGLSPELIRAGLRTYEQNPKKTTY